MTTAAQLVASGAHLVGSVPLASSEAVFRTITAEIGDRVRRIPDGETGPRSDWIVWQLPVFTTPRHLEVVPPGPDSWRPLPRVRVADGTRPEGVTFGSLGYADAALSSYRVFARLKRDGVVPVACRFQVCLPTPLAPISAFVVPEHQRVLEPVYEEQLLHELRLILQEIPHDQLAIQWDTNFEFGMLEGVFPVWFDDVKGGILERLLRLSRHVPPDVQLGYHFCYGDVQHRHFKEPADASKLVDVANALGASLGRPLNWVHLPVPRDRFDEAYYAPMRELRLRSETELYLGLVHHTDGVEGTHRRMDIARRFVSASASPPSAAGAGGRPTPSPRCCASTPRSAPRSRWPAGPGGGSSGRPASPAYPTRTGPCSRSTPSACATTPSRTTAGIAISTRPWRTWPVT